MVGCSLTSVWVLKLESSEGSTWMVRKASQVVKEGKKEKKEEKV